MTTEEKNIILTGKLVDVYLYKTAAEDCEEIVEEKVKVHAIKLNKYDKAIEAQGNDEDWIAFCKLCVRQPEEWFDRLHPTSLTTLYKACEEVNKNGFFAYVEERTKKKMRSIDGWSPELIQKLEVIGRSALQRESQK